MSNGDTLRVGLTQPPDNRATSATLLVHNGSAFGTQHTGFWVRRVGAPGCSAAIRGENSSVGDLAGVPRAGVLGLAPASSSGVGVFGSSTGSPGLFFGEVGVLGVTNSYGVVGRALSNFMVEETGRIEGATGVRGECDGGVGVHGVATTGLGVIGQSVSRTGVTGSSESGVAVEARSNKGDGVRASTETGVGVHGFSADGLAGVHGHAVRLSGVLGTSERGVGVAGVSAGSAVFGEATGNSGIGVVGLSEAGQGVLGDSTSGIAVGGRSTRGFAGFFEGNVVVRGGLFVTGGPKSALVKHADGTHRALFCMESPESYFEDFGEVALAGPSVSVKLDKDFACLVKCNNYQVFLTCYGPHQVYVHRRTPEGFEIARMDDATGKKPRKVRVGYRIVARRADLKAARLPKVSVATMVADVVRPVLPDSGKGGKGKAREANRKLGALPRPAMTTAVDLKALAGLAQADDSPSDTTKKRG